MSIPEPREILPKLKNQLKPYLIPVFAIILVQAPVWFVWHTELVFSYSGSNLTNGFADFSGMKIYHLLMYATFAANNIAGLYIINNHLTPRGTE